MTWEPTHVQFTVLRAKNLVGKLKGKGSSKISDVFVTIALGKEKFQTSTVKYGSKVNNSVEWCEECDLSIPGLNVDIIVHVMNRGLLSDEFIGYVAVPLKNYDVYERPKNHWVQLVQKPSKLPDGRCRGELEVRLTFHVKSRIEDTGSLKGKRTGSIKSIVHAVGDKLKFSSKSKSFHGDGSQIFSTSPTDKSIKNASTKTAPYTGSIEPSHNPVKFDAIDLYVPEQCWRENELENDLKEGNFARSYSLTNDQRKNNFKSKSLMNLPQEGSMTLPIPRRRNQPSLDDSAIGQSQLTSRNSKTSVTSEDGYLENMFSKECEVHDRMNDAYNVGIEEESEGEFDGKRQKSAQIYDEDIESGSGSSRPSEAESEEEITLPKVKLKQNGSGGVDLPTVDVLDSGDMRNGIHTNVKIDNQSVKSSEYHSIGSNAVDVAKRDTYSYGIPDSEESKRKSNVLDSLEASDGHASTYTSSSSISYQGKSATERAYDRGSTDSLLGSRKKISPHEDFSFHSQTSNEELKVTQQRRTKQYARGGRRFTIQGFEGFPTHRSAPDICDHKLLYGREDFVPGDLMAVYKNMNREELIKLVVTHKAQLIRKDQYIRELESYIDNLLVRVMENSPRILQNL